MEFEELTQPIKELETDDEEIIVWIRIVDTLRLDALSSGDIILELKKVFDTDRYDEKKPFYNILLAYASHFCGDTDIAINYTDVSADQFNRQAKDWNYAISCWFLGLLLCKQGHIDNAKNKIENAIKIVNKLEMEDIRLGYYDDKYKKLINTINDSRAKTINNKVVTAPSYSHTTTPTISIGAFSEIIRRLEIPTGNRMLDEWRMDIRSLNPSNMAHIDLQIANLNSMLEEKIKGRLPVDPFIYVFLAHCFNLRSHIRESQFQYALQCIWDAIKGFKSKLNDYSPQINDYNHALSRWYLGSLYCISGDSGSCRIQLERTRISLFEIQQAYTDRGKTDKIEKIQNLLNELDILLDPLESKNGLTQISTRRHETQDQKANQRFLFPWDRFRRTASNNGSFRQRKPDHKPSAPESTAFPSHTKSRDQSNKPPHQGEPPKNTEKPPSDKYEPQLRHIIIPVDVRAIQDLNVNSIPLESDLFEKLQRYEEKKENHGAKNEQHQEQKKDELRPRHIVIPHFPIYGQVSAGPNGEPNFLDPSELEHANEVDDTLKITFDGKECRVGFISKHEISNKDGKSYGWLKVKGESMNKTSPISINDNDHVLFYFNHDLNYCAGKIVVAYLSDIVTQPPQLVVKRLINPNVQSHPRNVGVGIEHPKFVLRSESSLDGDPRTGISYKKDIVITRNNQVAGEVVAIAKPI